MFEGLSNRKLGSSQMGDTDDTIETILSLT